MKLYNSLTRKIEVLKTINPKKVSLYSCGPTVYDYYHIGNLRNAVFNDTLRRTMELNNFKVNQIMNITDVGHLAADNDEGEDKLEKGAFREGKTVEEVAKHYTLSFKNDMIRMNILPPNAYHSPIYNDNYARATEFIDQQIEMVKILVDKGYAYITHQAIYFDVLKLPNYGELTGQNLKDKESGARKEVITDKSKKHPYDFALWFFAVDRFQKHSMIWKSPWGVGFPGWHLECSAIIHTLLGDPIDIHTGGVDHIGTHHPNEMAQTQAAFGHKLANYWIHNEFILVDGLKMAKSKQNSYTLKDLAIKGYDALEYRMMVLQAHYRKELNFSWEGLEAARNRLNKIKSIAVMRFQPSAFNDSGVSAKSLMECLENMQLSLSNDLNTPTALSQLSEIVNSIESLGLASGTKVQYIKFLEKLDSMLGLALLETKDLDNTLQAILKSRTIARQNKLWNVSDELRVELQSNDISIRDTDQGQIWFRI